MQNVSVPELWVWTEYYCPWSYIAVVRLEKVAREYQGQVCLVNRPVP